MHDSVTVKHMAMERISMGVIVAVAVVGVLVGALAAGLLAATRTIPNSGNVRAVGVGVFWNLACTNETKSINWGSMDPNSSRSFPVYVRNNGTVPLQLSIATSGWNPSAASSYMAMSWNCTGYSLDHDSIVAAVLTLSVLPNISGVTTFSFDITITGTDGA